MTARKIALRLALVITLLFLSVLAYDTISRDYANLIEAPSRTPVRMAPRTP